MTIQFERRTDRPDAAGRCVIRLRAYFEGKRLRYATRERCFATEWNTEKGCFKKSFPGYQEANDYLQALTERLQTRQRQRRTEGLPVTPEALKVALLPAAEAAASVVEAPAPLVELYADY